MEQKTQNRPDWQKLFESILDEPGKLGAHYHAFHKYSLGNQALAMEQLLMRGIQISPIASFNAWKEKGRKVKKGEKAIALWMPITVQRKANSASAADPGGNVPRTAEQSGDAGTSCRIFVMRNNWFAYAQTEEDPQAEEQPEAPEVEISWSKEQALAALGITEQPFSHTNGNMQGYACPSMKQIAINPIAAFPRKSTFHEIAHCLLHGDENGTMVSALVLERSLMEAEAESTAFLCCAALGLSGLAESRGYVQRWLGDSASTREAFKKSAGRVFSAADKILKAGLVVSQQEMAQA